MWVRGKNKANFFVLLTNDFQLYLIFVCSYLTHCDNVYITIGNERYDYKMYKEYVLLFEYTTCVTVCFFVNVD